MKKVLILLLLNLAVAVGFAQNIGIGTNTPDPSAKLDITSSSSGVLIPRMTTAQRNAITSPAKGLMVFDSSAASLWYYDGAAWGELSAINSNLWKPMEIIFIILILQMWVLEQIPRMILLYCMWI